MTLEHTPPVAQSGDSTLERVIHEVDSAPQNPEPSPVDELIKEEPVLYDAKAEQTYPFKLEDDENIYEVSHTFRGLPDQALIDHERNRALRIGRAAEVSGVSESKSNAFYADVQLWNELAVSIEGYGEGALPHNWKELVDDDDKATAVQTLLAFEIVQKKQKQRAAFKPLGQAQGDREIKTRAYFNGREVTQSHFMRPKTAEDIAAYRRLTGRVWFAEGDELGESESQIPPQLEEMAALYSRICAGRKGYSGEPPIHHKAIVMRHYLGGASVSKKKPSGSPKLSGGSSSSSMTPTEAPQA